MSEIYKDLPGWEGIYKISDHGNIASLDRIINGRKIRGRILKPSNYNKTAKVNLCTGKKSISKTYTVGYLVLLAFVGEKPLNARARYRDGDFTNNKLENLYWGSHSPNKKREVPNA